MSKNKIKLGTEFSDIVKMHLLKALEKNPEFSEGHFQLALMYQELKDYKTAENHFRKAIESDSEHIREIEKRSAKLLKIFQFQLVHYSL